MILVHLHANKNEALGEKNELTVEQLARFTRRRRHLSTGKDLRPAHYGEVPEPSASTINSQKLKSVTVTVIPNNINN
eukprot:5458450-Amphidinium_carterae.1